MSERKYDLSGRLDEQILARFLDYASRVVKLANELEHNNRPRRVIDQLIGSGTSSSANMYEAHEALSKADFIKCLGIVAKELNETRFWLLLIIEMKWMPGHLLDPLTDETHQLLSITKAMIVRSRPNKKPPR